MLSIQTCATVAFGLVLATRQASLNEQLLTAARHGDTAGVEAALAKGADVNARTVYGGTPLAFAADKGHLGVVRTLLSHKANPNARDSFYGAAPLSWAAMKPHPEIVRALVEAGATGGDTVLLNAVRQGDAPLVRAILASGKIKGDTLNTALTLAPSQQTEIVTTLKRAGAKPEKPGFTLDADTLTSFAGTYDMNGLEFTVVVLDGRLHVRLGERTLYVLTAVDANTFRPVGEPLTAVTVQKDGGKPSALVLKSVGNTSTLKRIDPTKVVAKAPDRRLEETPVRVTAPTNWPSFRGPSASGVADGQAPPLTWDVEKGANVLWKTPIPGLGHSCPVVWGDRVFVTTAVSGDPNSTFKAGQYGDVDSVNDATVHRWLVLCLDKRTGKVLWERLAHEGVPKVKRHTKASHANPTPATDGTHLIACFGSEGLYCYDLDGRPLWKRDLGVLDAGWFYDPDYQWGFASSPILWQGKVIVQCDAGKNAFIAAYDVRDGHTVWQTPRTENPSWGTPTLFEADGRAQVVTNATKFIRGYDARTGAELWRLGKNSEVTVGTPVCGEGLAFVTGGYPPVRPVYAIRPGATGDITLAKGKTSSDAVAWSNDKNGTYMPTPIVYRGHLYTCANSGLLTCYEAKTGKQLYQERLRARGGFTASPVAADGRLYFTSEEGGVIVVKAGPKFEVLTTNPVGEICMATPAISDGMFLLRMQHHLTALRVQKAALEAQGP